MIRIDVAYKNGVVYYSHEHEVGVGDGHVFIGEDLSRRISGAQNLKSIEVGDNEFERLVEESIKINYILDSLSRDPENQVLNRALQEVTVRYTILLREKFHLHF